MSVGGIGKKLVDSDFPCQAESSLCCVGRDGNDQVDLEAQGKQSEGLRTKEKWDGEA